MCFPSRGTLITSGISSPSQETNIPSDMCSPTWETHIALILVVGEHVQYIVPLTRQGNNVRSFDVLIP